MVFKKNDKTKIETPPEKIRYGVMQIETCTKMVPETNTSIISFCCQAMKNALEYTESCNYTQAVDFERCDSSFSLGGGKHPKIFYCPFCGKSLTCGVHEPSSP